ncbi:MAG TPA: hypothetical protein VL463_00775 [Kofleriaceae bacterium]|nr:hypothetical protein [Kofleriaceae bacterium]
MLLAITATVAIVSGDKVALRASPERTAPMQQVLWKGDWLEVRGARKGWLEVYDHRHERPGWIAGRNAHTIEVDAANAPALRAVVEYLRDTPGSETIGIAYAALYVKVAKPDAGIMTAIGVMADRVAREATAGAGQGSIEHMEVAQSWGLGFRATDDSRTCYDGDAYREALAMSPSPEEAATAALSLTDPACAPVPAGATEKQAQATARLAMLIAIDPTRVSGPRANELRLRRAELGAELAWAIARKGDLAKAAETADAATSAFVRVDKRELADDDAGELNAAALAIASVRWANVVAAPPPKDAPALAITDGEPGELCLSVGKSPPECTHGQVWANSFRVAPGGGAATVAVSPLPGWLELWLFRRGDDGGWMIDVVAPVTDGVDLGYVELAGWSPDRKRAVVVREAREDGVVKKTFQIVRLGTLEVEKQAGSLAGLGAAKAWAQAEWRQRTVALR